MSEDTRTGQRKADPETLIRTDRLEEVRTAYAAIARQVEILRSLDLGETHPAVVYRPLRRQEKKP
ncbi:hypothetical protein [Jiella marina]|uniref:hypothetical protein n=1 Tax=Jiella sp. LLJ827 TaxID=2917712 RepID=UPI0021017F7E|nr:hypothetical protein [Jiella sp. LLJ827]MCQ0988791.1 hypothetical protein [Jiella sp. LLJ827]